MTGNIKNICVYASSASDIDEIYYKTACELGELIGKADCNIVYGGSRKGLMYACAANVSKNGGRILGVMPQMFIDLGLGNPEDCSEFYVTSGMRERKAKLDMLSDAVVAISGGFGTLEEISEMIVQKQLGYSNKPTIILNTNGFYDDLIAFFEKIITSNFASENSRNLYYVAKTPQEVMGYIFNYEPSKVVSKFAKR